MAHERSRSYKQSDDHKGSNASDKQDTQEVLDKRHEEAAEASDGTDSDTDPDTLKKI